MRKFYTFWIIGIIFVVFILQIFVEGFTELFILNQRAVYNYEVWRFLTAIFLHGGFAHLLFNSFALIMFGSVAEKLIGSKRFLVLFFLSGIIANLISVNFYPASLGASGAIMGIIGALTIIRPFMMVWAFGLLLPIFVAAIFWIIGDLIGVFYPSGVGNIAHLSGIGVGILAGLVLRFKIKKSKTVRSRVKLEENFMRKWEDYYLK